ncbi:MAG: ABC transporter ATP-binding protein [Pseudomonadota bacterium]
MSADEPKLLETKGLTKVFGTLFANDKVDFDIRPGEIHALLGENGAGKSTLVKMLFGSLQPTEGVVEWRGEPVSIPSPSTARRMGIGMVFQHFSLFEALTVAENIALSMQPDVQTSQVAERARELSNQYGLPLDPYALVGDLSVGERQRIEIIRCLMQDPSLVILDEPTSVLTPQEADTLFETLFRLRDEGRAILYISHRLEEVQRLCSRATIMRHGKVVDICDPREETAATLAARMVGAELQDIRPAPVSLDAAPVVLSVRGLSLAPDNPFAVALKDINFDVHAGEVLGIAGIAGEGQGEFFSALSGEVEQLPTGGKIELSGEDLSALNISERRKKGAAFVPEERHGHGAVTGMRLTDNMLLARHKSDQDSFQSGGGLGVIVRSAIRAATDRVNAAMDVRKGAPDPNAGSLSGGNLQKFIMGRELDRQPALLVVNQPTWGVDAGAAGHIRQSLVDLAASGSAVIMISQDLDEIFSIATRIAVIAKGTLSEPTDAAKMSREAVGLLMTGQAADGGQVAA